MENRGDGQTDNRITKLVRVLDQILPSVTNSPNPLRVEEVDEVREDPTFRFKYPTTPRMPTA